MGTFNRSPVSDTGTPRRPAGGAGRGGASVVVGARENRVHGEGRQGVGQFHEPGECLVDSGRQADRAWLLSVQTKLYRWSQEQTGEPYRELWNWITDPRNLRCAWRRVASNKGRRTPGVDGETVGSIRRETGEDVFLATLRRELRDDTFRPKPSRRKLIPKPGQPGNFRPLGIPTIKDRVVQGATKQILEPIFEAQFWHVSYGFRPGRGCHGALEHIRMAMRPRATGADGRRHTSPYQWVIEGDIRGCFDQIDHHSLMQRVRRQVADPRVNRLLVRFLKAGVLTEEQFLRTPRGTPQGGIISPLLANIALSAIEERYERWVNHRSKIRACRKTNGVQAALNARSSDRRAGRPVFLPVRYADDFVILVSGSQEAAVAEKEALTTLLRDALRLELSPEKTKISSLVDGFEFLGHRIRLRWDPRFGLTPRLEIPKAAQADLRYRVKQITKRSSSYVSLARQLRDLRPLVLGWGHYYRFCTNAKAIFSRLDWYVGDRLWRWMRKKYPKAGARWILTHRRRSSWGRQQVWAEQHAEQAFMGHISVRRYQRGWMRPPDFARTPGEPDA